MRLSSLCHPLQYRDAYDLAPKLSERVSDWEYSSGIGIGHFDEDGYCPVDESSRCLSGRYVQTQRLDSYNSGVFMASSSVMKEEQE